MIRKKSKEGDVQLIHDESANVAERASAIFRLAVDGYIEMEPYLAKLLSHQEYLLRGESIKALLGGWGKERYLNKAVEMLHRDSEYSVRSDAAFSLKQFVTKFENGQKYKERVLGELLRQLQTDENFSVQKRCYEQILKTITGERFGIKLPNYFDRERDVDWNLLQPYLEKYNLLKPS